MGMAGAEQELEVGSKAVGGREKDVMAANMPPTGRNCLEPQKGQVGAGLCRPYGS